MADKKSISVDLNWIIYGLLGVIVAMLLIWQPWQSDITADRTIKETGEATISAEPDELVFFPSFEVENADQDKAKTELSKVTDRVIEKLKELGVAEADLTLNAYGYDDVYYYSEPSGGDNFNATASLEIIVRDKELAQEVQDYLGTTSATGQLTPQGRFSDAKQDELETQARAEAIADAKQKAETAAELLDAEIGAVITVGEGSGFDVYPLFGDGLSVAESSDARSSLKVLPGQNDFNYTVTVTFELK